MEDRSRGVARVHDRANENAGSGPLHRHGTGGADPDIPGTVWEFGMTGSLGLRLSDRWSIITRSTVYWHQEKIVASEIYIDKYRLAGIRIGLRYALPIHKNKSPQ